MFSLRFLLHSMALLGFALFLARCAGFARLSRRAAAAWRYGCLDRRSWCRNDLQL